MDLDSVDGRPSSRSRSGLSMESEDGYRESTPMPSDEEHKDDESVSSDKSDHTVDDRTNDGGEDKDDYKDDYKADDDKYSDEERVHDYLDDDLMALQRRGLRRGSSSD